MIDLEIIKSVQSIPVVLEVQKKIEFVKEDFTFHLSRAIESMFLVSMAFLEGLLSN